jgi:lipid-A-disaccharide synthase-like uncharacterized protein
LYLDSVLRAVVPLQFWAFSVFSVFSAFSVEET